MEFTLATGFVCLSFVVLGTVGLFVTFPAIAKKDLIKYFMSSIQQPTSELTDEEVKDNSMLQFDIAREIKLKKVMSNGAVFEDKITHGAFARNHFIVLNENKKVWEGNPNNFIIRGENLYKVLTGDSNIVLEYEDSDAMSHLRSMLGVKSLEIANLQARIKELTASTKKQIVDEHELRKEYTRARFGGNDPSSRSGSPFSPFKRFGGFGGSGGGGDNAEEEV